MARKAKPIPKGYTSITPYMVQKNCAEAIKCYQKALGAKVLTKMAGPSGSIMHCEIQIGNAIVMMSDEFPGMSPPAPSAERPSSMNVMVYSEKIDALFKKAQKAGFSLEMPLANMFWGDRFGKLKDPFGYSWAFGEHLEDVAPAEMKKRAKKAMADMAKGHPPVTPPPA